MDTISVSANVIGCEPVEFESDGIVIPVVVGFSRDGSVVTAAELAGRARVDPATCDHAGAPWSGSLALHCPQCGAALFLPPRVLAFLPASTITAMDLLWAAAGWPEWRPDGGWNVSPDGWSVYENPLFERCGGLPVRNACNWRYLDAVEELAR